MVMYYIQLYDRCWFPFRNTLQEISDYCLLKEEFLMSVSTACSLHRKPAFAWTSSKSFHAQGHLSIKIQFVLKKKKTSRIETSGITLTLILLTWRIWWAPNNASKWQMGFNLVFIGLIKHNTKIYNSKSAFISPIKTIKYIM